MTLTGISEPRESGSGRGDTTPSLLHFADKTGISAGRLRDVFEIERVFHDRLLAARSREERAALSTELYALVHPLLKSARETSPAWYQKLARLFARELAGRSVLDAGCGDGSFLRAIAQEGLTSELWGIDLFPFEPHSSAFQFIHDDVVSFELSRTFDVVLSSEVLEHIAPVDVAAHLKSVRAALKPRGRLILLTPNRLWGPHDITRIVDCSYSGRTRAAGSHLNELTYREAIGLLQEHGFGNLRTVLPFAHHFPIGRGIRIPAYASTLLESRIPRWLSYRFKWQGESIFKNPVVLIATKL